MGNCKTREKDYLVKTDVAMDVYEIIGGGPVPRHIKPIWPFIAFTAFNTLPKEFKDIYGINTSKVKTLLVNFNLYLLKLTRPSFLHFSVLLRRQGGQSKELLDHPTYDLATKLIIRQYNKWYE